VKKSESYGEEMENERGGGEVKEEGIR